MKNFLLVFVLVLICTAGGVYYTYSTNPEFASYVDSVIKKENNVADDSVHVQKEVQPIKPQPTRPRISKSIKPDKFFKVDEFARKTPKQYEKDIETLAKYLVSVSDSDYEKVRALFTWVATHIAYDAVGFQSGDFGDCSAEEVFKKRKSVCSGYSNLLKELCVASGFEAEAISGYAKGYGYQEGGKFKDSNHAWNAIKINGEWKLFDPTWASGYVVNNRGKLAAVSKFDSYWFDVKPVESIFTHLPEKEEWQLIDEPINLARYEELPYLDQTFFKIGFDSDKVFKNAISGNMKNFVRTYSTSYPIKAIQLPYERDLNKGDSVRFIIQSDYYDFIFLNDKKDGWKFFKQNGNIFELNYVPTGGPISISWSNSSLAGQTILEYQTSKK